MLAGGFDARDVPAPGNRPQPGSRDGLAAGLAGAIGAAFDAPDGVVDFGQGLAFGPQQGEGDVTVQFLAGAVDGIAFCSPCRDRLVYPFGQLPV